MILDHTTKGVPPYACINKHAVSRSEWNLLREDMDLPACVLRRTAIENNIAWMQELVNDRGALFAPHGKTYMSPELFDMQLKAGAWAITLATGHQVRVARSFGIKRIVLANQLVGKPFIRYIINELKADSGFEFYFLVDDIRNIRDIEAEAKRAGLERPLQVLLELGYPGGRCGCRSMEEALKVAAYVSGSQLLELRGIEGFEGYIHADNQASLESGVRSFLKDLIQLANACNDAGYLASGQTLLSVGGSAFYDLVFNELSAEELPKTCKVLTRSGCYLVHDAGMYKNYFEQLVQRDEEIAGRGEGLFEALEVWAYVLSRPEPGRIIVNAGKRDLSSDDLPVVHRIVRFSEAGAHTPVALADHRVVDLNDQHCHIQCPADSPVRAGDAVILGVSHPCLTFDKWRNVFIRDDQYNIVDAISTWF